MFKDFLQSIEGSFNGESTKILLLIALTGTYPLLAKIGFGLTMPLAIIVDSERTLLRLINLLGVFSKLSVVPTTISPKELKKHLAKTDYGLNCFRFGDGRYTEENMETIATACQYVESDIQKKVLRIIFSIERIPQKYAEYFDGFIYVKEDESEARIETIKTSEFLKELIDFCVGHIAEIRHIAETKRITSTESFGTLSVLEGILQVFLKTQNLTSNEIKEFERRMKVTLNGIEEEWQKTENPEAYATAFRNELHNFSSQFKGALDVEHFPGNKLEELEDFLLFDDQYYYLV